MSEHTPIASAAIDRDNPWPGLASFTEELRGFFFGREKETDELVRLVRRNTLTVLFGQSGLGKSSLLQAGAFPLLREADFLPLYLRLDHDAAAPALADQIKSALVDAFKTAGADAPAPRADESLWEYFHRKDIDIWSAKNRLLTPILAFDQFEEIFTLGRADETRRERGRAFLAELADLVENRPPAALRAKFDAGTLDPASYNFDKPSCQVILSLREDFLPDLEGLKNEMRSILTNRMRVKRLNGTQALEIVSRPAPHLLAGGVAERIVEFVAGARGGSAERLTELEVEPALLSVICRELNERRRSLGQAQITADLVSGNRREILTDFYERSVADLPEAMRAFVEDRLLTKSGFRDNLALETSLEFPGVTRPLLDSLVSRRLVRIEERAGIQRVELTHDVLAEVIRASRDARQQRLALEQSRAHEQLLLAAAARRTRKLRWLVAGLAAVVVALIAAGAYGLRARQQEFQRASRTDVGIASRYFEEGKTTDGLAYLLRAARKDPHNPLVAPRLASVLASRNFLLPEGAPTELGSRISFTRFSADGKSVFVAAEDGTMAVIEMATGRVTRNKLPAPFYSNGGIVVKDAVVAGLCRDGVVRVLERDTAKLAREIRFDTKALRAWSPRGTDDNLGATITDHAVLFVQFEDRSWAVVEIETGVTRAFPMPTPLAFFATRDGKWVVADRRATRSFEIWDTTTGKLAKTQSVPGLTSVRLTLDGSRLVTLARTGDAASPVAVQIWSFPAGEALSPPRMFEESQGLAVPWSELSDDGALGAVVSNLGVQIFDAFTGLKVGAFLPIGLTSTSFLPEGRRIATGAAGGVIIRDTVTGQPVTPLLPHGGAIREASFSADGRVTLSKASDGFARLWDTASGQLLAEPTLQQPIDFSTALSPDGTAVIIGTITGDVYRLRVGRGVAKPLALPRSRPFLAAPFLLSAPTRVLWLMDDRAKAIDAASGREVAGGFAYPEPIIGNNQPGYLIGRAMRADQQVMMVRTVAGKLCAWHLGPAGVTQSVTLEDVPNGNIWVRFSPAGDRVALIAASSVRTIGVWSVRTGQRVGVPMNSEGSMAAGNVGMHASFSPDGRRLATADTLGNAKVWDVESGKLLVPLQPLRDSRLRFAEFSPDGTRIATGNDWGEAQLWDAATGRPASPILAHAGAVIAATFSPDGAQLVTLSTDQTARAWDARTGAPVGEPMTHAKSVRASALDAQGRRLVTISGIGSASDGATRLWDVRTTQPVGETFDHPGVRGVAAIFSPDGRFVQTETTDSKYWLWSVPPLLPEGTTTPEWLLDLATICASKTVNAEGKFESAAAMVAKIDDVRRTLAALPDDAPYVEWGRWFLADRATRSIAPGFTITPAEAEKLAAALAVPPAASPTPANPTRP